MSASNTTENAILKMLLQGTDPSWRAGATQYLAAFSNHASAAADLEAGGRTYELSYTGYARVPITKATAWTDGGSSFTNAALVQFGKRTDAGATQTMRYYAIVDTASGDFTQCVSGQLSADLDIGQNIQPQFAAGTLEFTAS